MSRERCLPDPTICGEHSSTTRYDRGVRVLPRAVGAFSHAVGACGSFGMESTTTPPTEGVDADADACVRCPADGGLSDASARDPIASVRGGGEFACALTQAGAVSCWGRNNEGQTGQPPEGDLACDGQSGCRPTISSSAARMQAAAIRRRNLSSFRSQLRPSSRPVIGSIGSDFDRSQLGREVACAAPRAKS
jgi:hypothetical protein